MTIKKIINVCNNDEFISDGSDLIKEKSSEIKNNENVNIANNNVNDSKDKDKKQENIKINNSEKDNNRRIKRKHFIRKRTNAINHSWTQWKNRWKRYRNCRASTAINKCGKSTGNNITIANPVSPLVDMSKYENEIKELNKKLSKKDSIINYSQRKRANFKPEYYDK